MKRLILAIALLLTAGMAFGHENEHDPKHNAIHRCLHRQDMPCAQLWQCQWRGAR